MPEEQVAAARTGRLSRRRRFEPIAIMGVVVTLLLHGGTIGGVLLYRETLSAAEKPPPPPSYVVAKLVRKGKPRKKKKLPNKQVPQPATRKQETVDYTADADDAPARKKKDEPPRDRDAKVSDKLRRSLDKAELLAQAQREIEQEGSPDGVAGGTATEAGEGDPYMTKIADLWQRNWSLPAIIPRDEAKDLYVLLVLHIDEKGNIQFPLEFDRKSGNAHFDNSIVSAWKKIGKIPLPPPDRMASILANGLGLKHTWKGLR
jgi:hypothetical protein